MISQTVIRKQMCVLPDSPKHRDVLAALLVRQHALGGCTIPCAVLTSEELVAHGQEYCIRSSIYQMAYAEIEISGTMDSGIYQLAKDVIVIGRGGDHPVDVAIKHPSVSRLHLQIRRDTASGKFFVRNFGDYGSKLNGIPIPKSSSDPKHSGVVEMLLPSNAMIELSEGSVLLAFRPAAKADDEIHPGLKVLGP